MIDTLVIVGFATLVLLMLVSAAKALYISTRGMIDLWRHRND